MDVSDHTILLFLGIADGNIEDQRLEQIHFGAVPEVIAFLATGILDDDVTKTSRIRYKTDNPEALICLLSGRPHFLLRNFSTVFRLPEPSLAAHEGGHLLDALEGKRRRAERPHGDAHTLCCFFTQASQH